MMKKIVVKLNCGLCLFFTACMLYVHRHLIMAAIGGEGFPKAAKGFPACKG